MFVTATPLVVGVALDLALGDPRWLPHPVRGIGWLAEVAERSFRAAHLPLRIAGILFWITIVGIVSFLVWITVHWAHAWGSAYWIFALLACRDLDVEAGNVIRALKASDIEEARKRLSLIVGRDTKELDQPEIIRATVETVAENLSDGVIAPLFYLALGGPVGMAAYKAVNTLDSMVGYKNQKYSQFGWASARADDVANFLPARITAVLVCIVALAVRGLDARSAFRTTLRDGKSQPSPNAGYPEAAVAGALGVKLGGLNHYGGVPSLKATLGDAVYPLDFTSFRRVRVLLYGSEALFLMLILGCILWF